jgi:uncharacterized membrane protein
MSKWWQEKLTSLSNKRWVHASSDFTSIPVNYSQPCKPCWPNHSYPWLMPCNDHKPAGLQSGTVKSHRTCTSGTLVKSWDHSSFPIFRICTSHSSEDLERHKKRQFFSLAENNIFTIIHSGVKFGLKWPCFACITTRMSLHQGMLRCKRPKMLCTVRHLHASRNWRNRQKYGSKSKAVQWRTFFENPRLLEF